LKAIYEKRTWLVRVSFFFVLIAVDQLTKVIAKVILSTSGMLNFLGGTFRLQYTENPGVFLSLGANLAEEQRFWIFSVLIPIFLILVSTLLFVKSTSNLFKIGLNMIVAGGIGNLIDRFYRGRVIDFMNIGIGNVRTGIFNVADIAIMIGVIIIAYETVKSQKNVY